MVYDKFQEYPDEATMEQAQEKATQEAVHALDKAWQIGGWTAVMDALQETISININDPDGLKDEHVTILLSHFKGFRYSTKWLEDEEVELYKGQ